MTEPKAISNAMLRRSGMKALPKITRAKFLVGSLFAVALIAWTMTNIPSANAIPYEVSRSWSNGSGDTASLIGTVDVAFGSYTIMNNGPCVHERQPDADCERRRTCAFEPP